jgi:hypothetical protein
MRLPCRTSPPLPFTAVVATYKSRRDPSSSLFCCVSSQRHPSTPMSPSSSATPVWPVPSTGGCPSLMESARAPLPPLLSVIATAVPAFSTLLHSALFSPPYLTPQPARMTLGHRRPPIVAGHGRHSVVPSVFLPRCQPTPPVSPCPA